MSSLSVTVSSVADEVLADKENVDDLSDLPDLQLSESESEDVVERPLPCQQFDCGETAVQPEPERSGCSLGGDTGLCSSTSIATADKGALSEDFSTENAATKGAGESRSTSGDEVLRSRLDKCQESPVKESRLLNGITDDEQNKDVCSRAGSFLIGESGCAVPTKVSNDSDTQSSGNVTANEKDDEKNTYNVNVISSKRKLSAEGADSSSKSLKVDSATPTVRENCQLGRLGAAGCVKQLSRQQLEELVLRQMCRAIASNSLVGQLRRTVRQLSTAAERYQKKYTQLQKQYGDLQVIVKRLAHEQSVRSTLTYPLKVTRTVGIQVSVDARVGCSPHPSAPKTTGPSGDPISNKIAPNSLLKRKSIAESPLRHAPPVVNGPAVSASSSPLHSRLSNGKCSSRISTNGAAVNDTQRSVLVDLTDEGGGHSGASSDRFPPMPVLHPAAFPSTPANPVVNTGQMLPPSPVLKVARRAHGIVLSWTMELNSRHATIVSYHLFAYQETRLPLRSNPWKKVGDVKALPLPMACTLTQFQEGKRYHFAVRAEDNFRRRGPFSNASSISLVAPSSAAV